MVQLEGEGGTWDADAKVIRDGRVGLHRFLKLPVSYDDCVSIPISWHMFRVVGSRFTALLDTD